VIDYCIIKEVTTEPRVLIGYNIIILVKKGTKKHRLNQSIK